MFWLASYPKSGNTWLRVFLTNLYHPHETANINQLLKTYIANDNHLIEHYTPFEPSELTFSELQNVRRELYKELPSLMIENSCVKIHQANLSNEDNLPILKATNQRVVYIIRNPLDVVISLSFHNQWNIDRTIDFINNEKAVLGDQSLLNQRLGVEFLSSWSNHYLSWKETIPHMLLIRYEDMLGSDKETFSKVAKYLELDFTDNAIAEAISKSKISHLQEQEKTIRFKEGAISNRNFFRKGKSGEWKQILSKSQVNRITSKHGEVMKELGYL